MSTATATRELKGGLQQDHAEWLTAYKEFQQKLPEAGTILLPYNEGDQARLDVELAENKAPFIYGRVYVRCLVNTPVGWYLQSFGSKDNFGLKCILMPKARDELIRRVAVEGLSIPVKSLRVVRPSNTMKSLLCEVAEY